MKNPRKIVESTHLIYSPSILVRIKSTFIDSLVIVALMYAATIILDALAIESGVIRGFAMLLVVLYEPICTALNRTVGQAIMKIRVRNFTELSENGVNENISFPFAIVRFAVKITLGLISFVTIHSDEYGRAIHDKVANSVMVWD